MPRLPLYYATPDALMMLLPLVYAAAHLLHYDYFFAIIVCHAASLL